MNHSPASLTIDKFKVRALLRDPAFYAALVTMLVGLIPGAAEYVADNRAAFVPLVIVLTGHFGVRIAGTVAAGRAVSGGVSTPALDVEIVEDEDGLVA